LGGAVSPPAGGGFAGSRDIGQEFFALYLGLVEVNGDSGPFDLRVATLVLH
jgi:hypothetical protein